MNSETETSTDMEQRAIKAVAGSGKLYGQTGLNEIEMIVALRILYQSIACLSDIEICQE